MKGIILAGGSGTRLYPTTIINNKGLLPVYDKPMIYYPLCTLIENNIKDICLISSPDQINNYKKLFKNISALGINLVYKIQKTPKGIADSFLIAKDFIKDDNVSLILGDNIFCGSSIFKKAFDSFKSGATIFGYEVNDPERYGVIVFNKDGSPSCVVEKPQERISNYAIPGLYLFDKNVCKIAEAVIPSKRGELEIVSVIESYLRANKLNVLKINRGCAWLDAGTPKSLHESSEYVKVIEERQGIKIGCIEEAAYNSKFIDKLKLTQIAAKMPDSDYRNYLKKLI